MTTLQLKTITKNFIHELELAGSQATSSLPYISHTLPTVSNVSEDEVFQVIVVGGTVFRSARCSMKNGQVEVLSTFREDIPRFQTKADFIACMRKFVHTDVHQLALNFAYPLEPVFENGILDGKLVSGSKENDFNGMINEKVGQLIRDDLQKFRGQSLQVSCANDTVCLLLSGLTTYKSQELFGGIVGTGVNFAFFTGDRTLVNLESANFDRFPISEAAKYIDRDSIRSGQALFEKEVAGAYLYQHYNFVIEQKKLAYPLLARTAELGEIAKKDDVSGEIARNVLDHSASLVACQIAGIAEFKKRNIVGIMEGSLFWKGHNYKTLVETYLGLLTEYRVTFTKIDDDSILGAAYLLGD